MKKQPYKLMLPIIGSCSVLLFCVSAAASIADAPLIVSQSLAEPVNMILIGLGLMGFGKALR